MTSDYDLIREALGWLDEWNEELGSNEEHARVVARIRAALARLEAEHTGQATSGGDRSAVAQESHRCPVCGRVSCACSTPPGSIVVPV